HISFIKLIGNIVFFNIICIIFQNNTTASIITARKYFAPLRQFSSIILFKFYKLIIIIQIAIIYSNFNRVTAIPFCPCYSIGGKTLCPYFSLLNLILFRRRQHIYLFVLCHINDFLHITFLIFLQ